MNDSANTQTRNAAAGAAIARVLAAERDARSAIAQVEAEVAHIAEAARAAARASAAHTEGRLRRIVECIERDTAAQLTAIDAQAAALEHRPSDDSADAAIVRAAVEALARRLVGAAS